MMISNKSNAKSSVSSLCDQYILGKQIAAHPLSTENGTTIIDVSNFQSGMYQMVLLEKKQKVQTLQFSVVK
ncbi:MAG: hypothetical protein IPL95_10815 [Saprospiraceae bacterium]|nr:hypothetical protein [Saprospiraceae bacterium]